jgi:hypothetical protein
MSSLEGRVFDRMKTALSSDGRAHLPGRGFVWLVERFVWLVERGIRP